MCQISRLLLWKSHQECQNVIIEFCFIMRIFYELRYTVIIQIVWIFYLKSVPAKFHKYLKHISWVISGTSSSKLSCNPRHPSRTSVATIVTICCNHRGGEYFLHRITRKLGSTATSTVIRMLLPLTNYISGAENETQRALLGHTNGNIEMRSPSAAAMLTMVAATTIVRFPQCEWSLCLIFCSKTYAVILLNYPIWNTIPVDTWRNNNVIITSKWHRNIVLT